MECQRFKGVGNSNKRKRKHETTAGEDIPDGENQRPAKRVYTKSHSSQGSISVSSESSSGLTQSSTTTSPSVSCSSATNHSNISPNGETSSSDCYGSTVDFDLAQLGSPPDSVLACDETIVNTALRTPHAFLSKHDCGTCSARKSKTAPLATCIVTASHNLRLNPLPDMTWAESDDVWKSMCRKDDKASLDRNPDMLRHHPGLQPRMRAILLDWLIEVCEVYKLHRETYYLAVDYLDRFLSGATIKINKTHLQLIGITCLFLAAKVEEIYPPKIGEFAYVTDGACTEDDIVQQEMILLKSLNWQISPVTIIGWLSVYMQVISTSNHKTFMNVKSTVTKSTTTYSKNSRSSCSCNMCSCSNSSCSTINNNSNSKNIELVKDSSNRTKEIYNSCKDKSKSTTSLSSASSTLSFLCDETDSNSANVMGVGGDGAASPVKFCTRNDDAFIYPQFSGMEFAQAAQLLDLCTLDVGIANFSYAVIAAAAMYHSFDRKIALQTSGFEWEEIEACVKWMEPYYQVICEEAQPIYLLETNEQIPMSHGLQYVCPRLNGDESHILQTHTISMALYDKVVQRKEQLLELKSTVLYPEVSPAVVETKYPDGLLTPPASNRKPLDNNLADKEVDEQLT